MRRIRLHSAAAAGHNVAEITVERSFKIVFSNGSARDLLFCFSSDVGFVVLLNERFSAIDGHSNK